MARDLHRLRPAALGPVRGDQLRRAAREPGRERAVRPRARGVHRGGRHPEGRVRGRGARHALPRRDRGASARGAGQAAARARGAAGHPARRRPGRSRSRRGSSPRPTATWRPRCGRAGSGRTSTSGSTSTRSAVPPLRDRLSDVPALADQFLDRHLRPLRDAAEEARARRARPADGATSGGGTTSASSGTSSSG